MSLNNELYHFGILGQKWGRRRYQYPDGSLTKEGRERYGYKEISRSDASRMDETTKTALKEKIATRADARELYAYRNLFSDAELNAIMAHIRTEQAIRQLAEADIAYERNHTPKSSAEIALSSAKKFNDYYKTFDSTMNNLAKLGNRIQNARNGKILVDNGSNNNSDDDDKKS